MTGEEFKAVMNSVVLLGQVVRDLDLDGAQEVAQRALDFGPFFDPTAWNKGHKNCEQQLALLEPLIQFQRAVRKIAPTLCGSSMPSSTTSSAGGGASRTRSATS